MFRTSTMLVVLLSAAIALANGAAATDSFPSQPIRLISPFAAGGGNDTISRALAQAMARNLGQGVVVENRPGANTIIGMEYLAKSSPDGYSLIMTSSSLALNAALYPKLPYDSARAFAPVALVASSPLIVVVHPSLPVKSVRDLIAIAKAKPGQLFYPVSGVGNISHLAGELFNLLAGVKLVSVPYKGSGPGLNDLLGGRLFVGFNSALSTLPHIRSGRLRGIAVTAAARSPGLPDLPTVAESGVPGYEATTWYGVLAPAGTPKRVVHRLSSEIGRALESAEVNATLTAQGLDLAGSTPEQFATFISSEMVKWEEVVKATGIALQQGRAQRDAPKALAPEPHGAARHGTHEPDSRDSTPRRHRMGRLAAKQDSRVYEEGDRQLDSLRSKYSEDAQPMTLLDAWHYRSACLERVRP